MQRKLCEVCQCFYMTDELSACFCPSCKGTYEAQRKKCIEYFEVHRNASIIEVSMSTNIPIKSIKKLISDGVLSIQIKRQ